MRPTQVVLILLLASLLAACATAPARPAAAGDAYAVAGAEDRHFATLAARWLDGALRLSPVLATRQGDHRFDGELDDMSAAGRQAQLDFARAQLKDLESIDATKLGRENQIDAGILGNELRYEIWAETVNQDWAWDPLFYNGLAGDALYSLMARDYAPMAQRLASATARLEKLPAFLAQARQNLELARVPRIHAETVAKQNPGLTSIIDDLIAPNASQLAGAERARLDAAMAKARAAIVEHQKWIESVLVPGAKGDFRLGKERYAQKLAFALDSSLGREEIRQRAEAELKRVRAQMYGIARTVLKGRPDAPPLPEAPSDAEEQKGIAAALELAYVEHPARTAVVDSLKQDLAEATTFVREHDLVTVPSEPVRVIPMPEFQRGVVMGYCDSPGPLDRGQATYFAIAPIPDDWTAEQTESYLREYNSRMLRLLTIHEAMPGHYLEGIHSQGHPSVLRAVLRSGVFAEGWAVYTERMMAESGYLGSDPLFRLVQLKFYLRAIGNAILDAGVHVDGWTREQAIDFMVKRTFQQEREAAGKWTRVQVTSAQLPTYFVGVQEQLALRQAVEAKEGAAFNLKRYHDAVLSYGAPPVRYVRAMMLGEPIAK
jgi:uncharacterized protein (DUF885 family)